MFDLGFPPPLQKSIARKFNNRCAESAVPIFSSTPSTQFAIYSPVCLRSVHAECLVSYRPPRRVIHEYGYAVTFVDQVLCSMHGTSLQTMPFCLLSH
jgi:hypothetical protein